MSTLDFILTAGFFSLLGYGLCYLTYAGRKSLKASNTRTEQEKCEP